MRKSRNIQVQKLINDIKMHDIGQYKILMKLRDIVLSCNPEVQEKVMYGGIMFSIEDDFGGLFVRKEHISFEFGFGVHMKDPDGVLEGTGVFRRHLKLRSLHDIESKKVVFFVEQALEAETS